MIPPCARVRRIAVLVGATLCIGLPSAAHADPYQEFLGVRSEAMGGAHRGLGNSNETIMLNPAGMALTRRYSIDATYGYSAQDTLSHASISALDSKTGPVAGGLAYTFSIGDHAHSNVNLHRIYLASAYAITDYLAFGMTARHIRGEFNDENGEHQNVEVYTGDLGIMLALFHSFGIGVTYHNTVTSSRKRLAPPHMGIGLGYQGESLALASDMEIDLRDRRLGDVSFRFGAEYFIDGQFAFRAGYRFEPFIRKYGGKKDLDHVLSGGFGWVTESGSVEIAYTQSVILKKDWDLIGSFKFFLK